MRRRLPGFIRNSELSRDRSEQRPDRFAVGEKVDAKITAIDRATRRLSLSIKAQRGRGGEAGDGRVRLVRLRRQPRRHPRRGDPPPPERDRGSRVSAPLGPAITRRPGAAIAFRRHGAASAFRYRPGAAASGLFAAALSGSSPRGQPNSGGSRPAAGIRRHAPDRDDRSAPASCPVRRLHRAVVLYRGPHGKTRSRKGPSASVRTSSTSRGKSCGFTAIRWRFASRRAGCGFAI